MTAEGRRKFLPNAEAHNQPDIVKWFAAKNTVATESEDGIQPPLGADGRPGR